MAYRRHHSSFLGLWLGGSRNSPVYRIVVAVFVLLGGGLFFLVWCGEKMAYDELMRTCISETEGTIISVRTSTRDNSYSNGLIKFTAGGKEYTMYTGFTLDKKAEGDTIPVHYCPADPEKAYLYDEAERPDDKLAGYAAVALAIAIVLILLAVADHQRGVESGGVIGDYLKSKKNFEDDSWKGMSEEDLANARRALTMPDYAHVMSEIEEEKKRRYRY